MGAGASVDDVSSKVAAATPAELTAMFESLPADKQEQLLSALKSTETVGAGASGTMKIIKAESHFNPGYAFGAPRPEWMDKMDALAKEYGSALSGTEPKTDKRNDAVLALFAADASWTDPVGGDDPPFVGAEAIKELLGKIPEVISAENKEVFYTASPKIFLVRYEVLMKGQPDGKPATLIDRLEVNDDFKIMKAESHFNPGCAFGAPRPEWMDKMDALAKEYGSFLHATEPKTDKRNDPVTALFAADASWTDPVGGDDPPFVGAEAIKELLGKIPEVISSENKEVFYTASPKIFLVRNEILMKGQDADKPAILLDRIEVA